MAATYQRVSGGRLLLNVVTGGDDVEQQRFGDHLGKDARYERAGEFLHIVRALWSGDPVTFAGRHYDVRGGQIIPAVTWPEIYLGGSSAPALDVAARYADVYLTWGEPPQAVAQKLDAVRARAKAFASDTAVEVASDLFSLAGASAADERYDLSRHWRNARTHASHDPVDWKYHHVGNYLLNDAFPPNHGQL